MPEQKSEIAREILRRVRWLYVLFLLAGVAIFGRVLFIQYGPSGDELRAKARRITYERVDIEAERGDILARDGRILATSIPTYEIRMDFAAAGLADSVFRKHVDSLAYCLSSFFGDKSKAAYKQMLMSAYQRRKSNRYKLIAPRRVNYLEEKTISRFPILRLGPNRGGYISVQVNQRLKPHGSLADRTIGMVNRSGVKLGIEGAFDEQLRGTDGNTLMQRVSGSFKVPVPDALNVEPVNGMDVVTTLDVDIQDVAETALKKQLDLGEAEWGTVVLMEVATGEIRAMSNLHRKSEGVFVEDFNYAIGRRMEPGSTFKLASLITLLEDGKLSLDKQIDCEGGRARVGRRVVVDDHKENVLTLREVFEVSSNIGFAKAVNEVYGSDPARFVNFISNLGFGKPLGMQIAGEQRCDIKRPEDRTRWDGTTLVMMSYGYALEVTPMHTLALYNAVANGGRMMRPLLVREVRNYGQTVRTYDPEEINPSICSKETLAKVRECLEGVVDEGTARALRNPYYKVAAKTGTAQVPFERGGYVDSHGGRNYLATLVGYFPADNPKYSCIVAIKTYYGPGSRHTYYGASLSGPVFKAIADRVYASSLDWQRPVEGDDDLRPGPAQVKNGKTEELNRVARKLSVPIEWEGEENEWACVANLPEKGKTENESDTSRALKPGLVLLKGADFEAGVVPSVVGMGLKDALFLLESRGMVVAFSGRGRVVSQSVPAGTRTVKGQLIALTLAP